MKSYCTFLLIFLFGCAAGADLPQRDFEAANREYQKRNYAAAASAYEELTEQGYYSAELYYNLANSYWKSGRKGKAVLNFERALRLAPGDEDIRYNLELVRSQLEDNIERLPPFFLSDWWNRLVKLLPVRVWTVLSILGCWLMAAGVFFWLFGKDRPQKKKGFIAAAGMLVITFIVFALSYSRYLHINDRSEAIFQEAAGPLMSAPDEESVKMLDLHEGTKVLVIDSIGEWYKVSLANGDQGWLEMSLIERI